MDIRKYFTITTLTPDNKNNQILNSKESNSKESNNQALNSKESNSKESNSKEKVKVKTQTTDIIETNNTIEVFTDGSTFNNGKKNKIQFGGIGVYFNDDRYPSISECLYGKITNNIAELKAIIVAIDYIINLDTFNVLNTFIHIYSDSEYTINSVVKWSKTWEKNGWKKRDKKEISNKDLIIKLYNYYKKYKIKFIHVKAHTSEPKDPILHKIWYGNKMADKLATDSSKKSSNEFYNEKGFNSKSKSKSFFPSATLPESLDELSSNP
jgi:ribonuclease HI